MSRFFALLLLGGMVGLVVASAFPSGRKVVGEAAMSLTAMVAVGATAGSLYFSEVAGFVPCELCWFQRIAMYPLAIIVPVAAVRKEVAVFRYVRILAVIGLLIALYHAQLQAFPDQGSFCALANPCTSSPVKTLRWITIPHMAAISFALVAALSAFSQMNAPDMESSHE